MNANGARIRRYHTRNRTGCSTCRRRHVRCDEKRPSWYVCDPGSAIICRVAQQLSNVVDILSWYNSSNCLVGKRACEYPTIEPTLRDRRSDKTSLPGQQQPWALHEPQGSLVFSVSQLTRTTSGDPFDSLAVQMPLKSQELFYYCEFHSYPLYLNFGHDRRARTIPNAFSPIVVTRGNDNSMLSRRQATW